MIEENQLIKTRKPPPKQKLKKKKQPPNQNKLPQIDIQTPTKNCWKSEKRKIFK